jgi:branched-chain amino acid aminotransferase
VTVLPPHPGGLPAIWVNGERKSSDEPHLSAADRGLTLADGAFETMRAHAGVVFRLDRHLARLAHALATLEIEAPPDVRSHVLAAVRGADAAAVRLVVTRGVGGGGVAVPPSAETRPTVIVSVSDPPVFPFATYEAGLTAHIASGRRNEHAMTAGLKTLAYTDSVLALIEARRAGADEAIFLDTEGHCSEATASNVFIWAAGTLVTPPLGCGALPGITRATVLELAGDLGVPTAERAFDVDELASADEAFLTSSLRGLAPLVRIGLRRIGRGTPGALTHRLSAAYTALVARECGATVQEPDR